MKVRQCLGAASLMLIVSAPVSSAELLFTNFEGDPYGGNLYTAGGPCASASCFAISDNFSNAEPWTVSGITFYLVSPLDEAGVGSNGRYALLTAAGAQIVAPTDTALTVTDTGFTYDEGNYKIYKLEISGLNIALVPGEYQFRFTNTANQGIFPAYGDAGAQTLSPGFIQLTGSPSQDPLLSTLIDQRDSHWAFQIFGPDDVAFEDGFETP